MQCLVFRYKNINLLLVVVNTTSTPTGWEGWGQAGSYEAVGKGYINTKSSQMAFIGTVFTYTYHKVAKSMAKLISQSCRELQLTDCLSSGVMEPFEDHLSTHGCLHTQASETNHSKSSLAGKLSASIPS